MQAVPHIDIHEYRYDLPDERIARYPLPERDASRLLVWKDNTAQHRIFRELPDLFTGEEVLFFNDTKVIPARLYFRRPSGTLIEVFLLHPVDPGLVETAMRSTQPVTWACTIGNLKKWTDGLVLERTLEMGGRSGVLKAELVNRSEMLVRLSWDMPHEPMVHWIEAAGEMPLPPYLKREAEDSDRHTYQTVYSEREGAVAAPTAGLHFTPELLDTLRLKGVITRALTLHVSAGTFRPVKVDNAVEHDMHHEQVAVSDAALEALQSGRPVVAVGTTSMRTLESVYWYGVKLLYDPSATFGVEQHDPYRLVGKGPLPPLSKAVEALRLNLKKNGAAELHGSTALYIYPGYRFQVVDALITNFHQPSSTLLLLVAAFTGGDAWKAIYQEALENRYRFLSYGDSSLLYRFSGSHDK